jgi:hypothetical protein
MSEPITVNAVKITPEFKLTVKIVKALLSNDPSLTTASLPKEDRQFILDNFPPISLINIEPSEDEAIPDDLAGFTESSLISLLKEIVNLTRSLDSKDVGEKIQIIKTGTAIVEKLVVSQERVKNLKNVSEYQKVVRSILRQLIRTEDDARLVLSALGGEDGDI